MQPSVNSLTFRNLRSEGEVHAGYKFEQEGYPEDEAASLDGMLYRYRQAGHLLLGAFDKDNNIVGYIMSTRSASPLVTHESMETHDPRGSTVCIHSVCVKREWQRIGVANKLLTTYTEAIRQYNKEATTSRQIKRLAMMSREHLVPMYERAGYKCLGESSVVHGNEKWFDCVIDL